MNYKVKIYQINEEVAPQKMFNSFEGAIKMSDYKLVYNYTHKSELKGEKVLDEIYSHFNGVHPKDYKGRSISVSDLIVLNGIPYFVDKFGFRKIDEIC